MPKTKKSWKPSTYKKKAIVPYKKFPQRAYVYGTPSIGLGPSARTIIRTSFFANCTAAGGTGIYTGFLAPGNAFDPTGDQSTIQGNTFDQFAAVYSRYKVNSCKIKLNITGGLGGSSIFNWVCAAYPSVDSTALTTYQNAASQPGAKTVSGVFQTGAVGATSVGLGGEPKSMYFNLNHKAVLGTAVDAFDSGALVSASPTAGQYMVLPFLIQANSAVAATFVIEVDMWQDVSFLQRKNVVDA